MSQRSFTNSFVSSSTSSGADLSLPSRHIGIESLLPRTRDPPRVTDRCVSVVPVCGCPRQGCLLSLAVSAGLMWCLHLAARYDNVDIGCECPVLGWLYPTSSSWMALSSKLMSSWASTIVKSGQVNSQRCGISPKTSVVLMCAKVLVSGALQLTGLPSKTQHVRVVPTGLMFLQVMCLWKDLSWMKKSRWSWAEAVARAENAWGR